MSDFEDNDKDAKKHFVKAIEAKVEVHTFQFPDYSEEGIRELGRALKEEMRILEEGKYSLVKERVGNVTYGKFREKDWR